MVSSANKDPAFILFAKNQTFPENQHNKQKHFTIFILDLKTVKLTLLVQ